ncbi:histidine kinase [Oscillospiraceae bacterium PP1C4]
MKERLNNRRIIPFLRRISIRRRMLLSYFLICFLPMTAVITITASSSIVDGYGKHVEYIQSYAAQSQLKINSLFSRYEKKFKYLTQNNDILADVYIYENQKEYRNQVVLNRVDRTLVNILGNEAGIPFAMIHTASGEMFSYGDCKLTKEQIQMLSSVSKDGKLHWSLSGKAQKYVLISENVRLRYDKTDTALMVIAVDADYLSRVCSEISVPDIQRISLADTEGNVYVVPEDGGWNDVLSINSKIPANGWQMINEFQMQGIGWTKDLTILMFIGVTALLIALLLVFLVTRSITLPLGALLNKIRQFGGTLGTTEKAPPAAADMARDEHALLSAEFDRMTHRLSALFDDMYRSKIGEQELTSRIRELELNALQQQINPHFLYNVLENIYWIASMNGHERIGDMISALGNYFKTSVTGSSEYVTIFTELENVKSYIQLQQIMHEGRFTAEWTVLEELTECKTVKLILQPIIENCVVHGFSDRMSGGKIHISCDREDGQIVFSVQDNGRGMSADEVASVQRYIEETDNDVKRSVGVKNVNQRIKIYFGADYGLTFSSQEGVGTLVRITIPVIE